MGGEVFEFSAYTFAKFVLIPFNMSYKIAVRAWICRRAWSPTGAMKNIEILERFAIAITLDKYY